MESPPLVFDLKSLQEILKSHGCEKFHLDFTGGIKNGSTVQIYNQTGIPRLFAACTLIIIERLIFDKETGQMSAPVLFSGFYLCQYGAAQSIIVN
jgi:hypothetical protein